MDDDNEHGLPYADFFSDDDDFFPDDLFELLFDFNLENIQIDYVEVEEFQQAVVPLPNGVLENGNVNQGLPEEIILGALEQALYHKENAEDDDDECSICLQAFAEDDEIGKLECGHFNHFDCIKEWLKRKNVCTLCGRKALRVEGDD